MSAVYLGSFEPGSDEWLAARRHAIGGSEIAAVLGLSPWESRFSLFHRKQGSIGPVEESDVMEWGKRLEAPVAEKFAEVHPDLFTWGTGQDQFAHADRPWQIAAPDRQIVRIPWVDSTKADALLECKTARYADEWGDDGTDAVPLHYRCQAVWYLDTFGLTECHVAVLIGGSDYREYVVTYDPAEAELLRNAAVAFLADITNNRRPDIDEHTATYQAVRELHPDIDPHDVDIDYRIARRFILAKAGQAAADAEATCATALLADAMGTAKRALWNGDVIATRQARGEGTPYVVKARNLPDLEQETAA